MSQNYQLLVPAAFAGERLDKFLADALPKTSRSTAQRLLALGHVTVKQVVCDDASRKIQAGDAITVFVPSAEPSELKPANIPLEILFEDSHLLVINKPAGLTVHPAPGEKGPTLVHALLHHCGKSLSGIGGVARPGIVHRLDKDTSGAMLVAKNDAAHQSLSEQLQDRSLSRLYHAVVFGVPRFPAGMWEGNIGRAPNNRKKMAVLKGGGKEARTHFKVVEQFHDNALSLLELKLETGRTHQIRVHAAHHGYPLVGDPQYGRNRQLRDESLQQICKNFPRQALHAAEISFVHPATKEVHRYAASYPEDFKQLLLNIRA
jgi:23S rRNA pseudouridine1911/1915/1917 synthase